MRRALPLLLLAIAAAAFLLWPRPAQGPAGTQDASELTGSAAGPRLAGAPSRADAFPEAGPSSAPASQPPYRFEVLGELGPLEAVSVESSDGLALGKTDADGRLTTTAPGHPASHPLLVLARKTGYVAANASAARGDVCRILLARGASIAGRVTIAPDDRPVAGALVVAGQGVPHGTTRTDANGEFAFDDVPKDTTVAFTVRAPGWATVVAHAKVPGPVSVRLAEGGVLEGFVTDAEGTPIPEATVYVLPPGVRAPADSARGTGASWRADAEETDRTTTDAAGRYEIAGIAVNEPRVAVAFASPTLHGRGEPVTFVKAGERARRDVAIPAPGALHVVAEGTAGAPLDEMVYVSNRELAVQSTPGSRAADGSWLFPALTPGRYEVRLLLLGSPFVGRAVAVESGKTAKVRLSFRFTKAIEGRVVRRGGLPASGAMLWWVGPSGTLFTQADPQGRFRFQGLEEKPGALVATTPGDGETARTVVQGLVPGAREAVTVTLGERATLRVHLPELEPGTTVVPTFHAVFGAGSGPATSVGSTGTLDVPIGTLGIETAVTLRSGDRPPLRIETGPFAGGEVKDVGERRFGPGRTVLLRVVDAEGAAVEGASVLRDDENLRPARTDARGETTLPGVQREAFLAAVESQGRPTHLFTVPAQDHGPVALRLEAEGTLEVRVFERDGAPSVAARVTLLPAEEDRFGYEPDAWTRWEKTDAAGTWRGPVQPRAYRIRVRNLSGESQEVVPAAVRPREVVVLTVRLP